MTLPYFTTSAREDEDLPIIKDAINWLQLRYDLKASVVRSDDEMARNRTKAWLIDRGISFERCGYTRTKRYVRTPGETHHGKGTGNEALSAFDVLQNLVSGAFVPIGHGMHAGKMHHQCLH
jgi:hypothetical protein